VRADGQRRRGRWVEVWLEVWSPVSRSVRRGRRKGWERERLERFREDRRRSRSIEDWDRSREEGEDKKAEDAAAEAG
jgi:hypothetical protein